MKLEEEKKKITPLDLFSSWLENALIF